MKKDKFSTFRFPVVLVILLNLCSNNLIAQQKLTEFSVRIARPTESYIVSDQYGNVACIFQSGKEYEVDFLNSDMEVFGTAITEKIKIDKTQKIIGALLKQDACYAYFYNKKIKALSCLEVIKSTGEATFRRIRILGQSEEFLRGFEMNGRFHLLTIPKNSDQVKVITLEGNQESEFTFITGMPGFYPMLSKKNDLLNAEAESEVGIEEVKYDMDNNIKSTYPTKKLYHFDDKIFLTFDDPNTTHLVVLDVQTQKSEYKKLNFSLDKGNNSKEKQGNSYLYHNRFFRTTISPDELNITILNLDSMNLINSYNFYPGQEISIANGPIMQEGGTPSIVTEEKVVKKSEQFFRRVLDGNIAIAANLVDSSKYEISLGSYELYQVSRPGYTGGFGAPSISFGMGMGTGMGIGFGSPMAYGYGGPAFYNNGGFGYPGYYSYQPTARLRVVYFKSLLDKTYFNHLEGNAPASIKDRINEYENRVFRNNVPEVIRIAGYNNGLLLGYYQKNGRKYNLIEFRK